MAGQRQFSYPRQILYGISALFIFSPITLKSKQVEIDILPSLGCRWTALRVLARGAWRDVLWPSSYPAAQFVDPFHTGAFYMAPWTNRVANARFEFEGRSYRLESNNEDGTAIHGDVYRWPWSVESLTERALKASFDSSVCAGFNFPWPLLVSHTIVLESDRARFSLEIENRGTSAAPVGAGFHPYFRNGLSGEEPELSIKVPAARVFPSKNAIPLGAPAPVSGINDLRTLQPVAGKTFDFALVADPKEPIELRYERTGVAFSIESSADPSFVYVYTPPDAKTTCVEPMTMAVNAFNLKEGPTGIVRLEPKERWSVEWTLRWSM